MRLRFRRRKYTPVTLFGDLGRMPVAEQLRGKERVTLSIGDLVGDRRWVIRDGRFVEIYGSPREGDVTVVKSVS